MENGGGVELFHFLLLIENPNVLWKLDNKSLRFKTASNISSATKDWYVRIKYIKMNITAGMTNNVDTTVT